MELTLLYGVLLSLSAIFLFRYFSNIKTNNSRLRPPGNTGWPMIGESIEFLSDLKRGESEKFIFKRMTKYSPDVFKTSILGNQVIVLCGASGSKFLFSNANKLVKRYTPSNIKKILQMENRYETMDQFTKSKLITFLKIDVLKNFVGVMDTMAQQHLESHWGQKEITVYPSVKNYAFTLACRLLLSVEDPDIVEKLFHPMEILATGIISLPIDLPGTPMNRARKASVALRLQIQQIVQQQRLNQSSLAFDHHNNLLTYFLQVYDDDVDIAIGVMGMLIASHETITSVLSIIFKVMADNPDIYQRIHQENMESATDKEPKELLKWEDIQKLKYTWNVAREVMRIYTPTPFLTVEAIDDFTYAGYDIPKGFKLITSICATHKDPKYFPEPHKFEPSRFEGDGPLPYTYLPFGGGPNICPGMNYAQVAILMFIHHAVKRFKWESKIPGENITGIPFPKPAKGLPLILHPYQP